MTADESTARRGLYVVKGRSGPLGKEIDVAGVATTDVTVAAIDEMEGIHGGLARRARATLGVSSWGMQVLTLPPNWGDYPNHNHDENAFDPNQEEVYIPVSGSATLVAGEERFDLVPGMMARVGPEQSSAEGRARLPLRRGRSSAHRRPGSSVGAWSFSRPLRPATSRRSSS